MLSNLRLFISAQIGQGAKIQLEARDIHYLINVMKINDKEEINIFNEHDGEWTSRIRILSKNDVYLEPISNIKKLATPSKVILAFALLKRQNTSLVIQKATELNVCEIYPILTERTIVRNANIEKLKLIAKEASEQCGRLDIPKIHHILDVNEVIKRNKNNNIILCDNKQKSEHILQLQEKIECKKDSVIFVGPEGGFSQAELIYFHSLKNVFSVSLGALTLRAETAVITSLFSIQAIYNLNKIRWGK